MSRINTNIASLQAITSLNKNSNDLATRLQRLSTRSEDQHRQGRAGRSDCQRNASQRNQRHPPGHRQFHPRRQRDQHGRRRAVRSVRPAAGSPGPDQRGRQQRRALAGRKSRPTSSRSTRSSTDQPHRQHDAVQRREAAERVAGLHDQRRGEHRHRHLPDQRRQASRQRLPDDHRPGDRQRQARRGRFRRRRRRHQRRDASRWRATPAPSSSASLPAPPPAPSRFAVNQLDEADRRQRAGQRQHAAVHLHDLRLGPVRQRQDDLRHVRQRQGLRRRRQRQHQRRDRPTCTGLDASVRNGDLDISLTLDKDFAQNTTSRRPASTSPVAERSSRSDRRSIVRARSRSASARSSTTKLGNDVTGFLSSLGSGGANSLVERQYDPGAEDPDRRDPAGGHAAWSAGRAAEGRARHQCQQPSDRAGERHRQRKRHPRRRLCVGNGRLDPGPDPGAGQHVSPRTGERDAAESAGTARTLTPRWQSKPGKGGRREAPPFLVLTDLQIAIVIRADDRF